MRVPFRRCGSAVALGDCRTLWEAPGVIVGDPMAACQAFAGLLYGESAIWKSCAGCAPTEAAKRPSGVVVASGAERTRNPKAEDCRLDGGPLVKWHARRSCRGGPLPHRCSSFWPMPPLVLEAALAELARVRA